MKEVPDGRLFELRTPSIPLGAFIIAVLPPDTIPDKDLNLNTVKVVFYGDNMAADLIGPQIAATLYNEGESVGIVLNPDEDVALFGDNV